MLGRAAAFAFLIAAAQPALADVRSETALRSFIAALDSAEEWSASADLIRSEGADTLAEGVTVTRRDPGVSVRLQRLRIRDLDALAGGAFSASEIEASGAEITSEHTRYAIPTATASRLAMPSFAGLSIDVHRLMSSTAQFYAIAAEGELRELLIPEIAASGQEVPPGETEPIEVGVVYRNIRVAGLRDGIIESQKVGPVSMTAQGPEGSLAMEVASMFTDELDLGALARILDETQYLDGRGDGVWRPVVSRIGYSGLSGTAPEGVTFKIEEFALSGVDGRQPDKPFTRDFDRLLDPDLPDSDKSERVLEALRTMYSAWRLGELRLSGVDFQAPAQGGAFSLATMALSGLSTAGLDSFTLEGINGRGPGGSGALGSLELKGVIFPEFKALAKFAALENDAAAPEHEQTLRAAFAALPRFSHFGLHDLAGGQTGGPEVKLAGFTFDLADWNDMFAQSTDIRLEGLDVPRSLLLLDPQATEAMDALGYERFVLGLSLSDRWSPADGRDRGHWTLSMRDAVDVDFSYTIAGVTTDWIMEASAAAGRSAEPNAALMTMLAALGLENATLKVTDRSLLDRAFGYAAKKQGLSVDGAAYRNQMRGALPFLLSAAVPPDLAKLLTEPMQAFLGGGQTLVAEIAPAQPIPLTELVGTAGLDPMKIPAALGLTLRSEPAPAQ